ncbi:glycine betaine/proline transport system substrate-binding protein [Salsuginibacillus halophilus]|uniref:Glycine betaine/proline transport system substrate-binding protein n=1 Tax=Salsuginibacillus halophilus TaxID=517424 RepID=A0A2P8HL59_9BACI|nr:glycine betaine ABC transporter substrate-binding protein [Salsuginibacillus halophilus]PSL46959.1 glycine betaine/proline transport system substrate-binding protein [Salsuginibacillus halophilus]
MKAWKKTTATSVLVGTLILAGCGDADGDESNGDNGGTEDAAESGGSVEIGYNNWAENIAVTNMWAILLEEEGYDVEMSNMEKAPLFAGVASGDIDIGMEVWLPTTDQHHVDEYGDDFDVQGEWYEGTVLGLAVPEYMEDVNSIEDLNDYAEEFDETIMGIEPGSSLVETTEEVQEAYDLDLELQTSSEQAMISELDSAYSSEEPIVVTMWSPHWVLSEYDIKYLEDPENVYGDGDDIVYISRDGFEEEYEEVVQYLNNMHFDDETLGALMAEINETDDAQEGAQAWIDDNRELVDEWLEIE